MATATRAFVVYGVVLGLVFGAWNLLVTLYNPQLDDNAATLLRFYGPMFACWGVAGFVGFRRRGRLRDAVVAGVVVACATFVVFDLLVIARVNLFLAEMTQRADWQNLLGRYERSGFTNLRSYVNYEYAAGTPLKVGTATAIGAIVGLLGGLAARVAPRPRQPADSVGRS